MKYFLIILKDLKGFMTVQSRVFIIMILGLAAAFFVFIYLYALNMDTRNEFETNFGYKNRTYSITFNSKNIKQKYKIVNEILKSNSLPAQSQIHLIKSAERDKDMNLFGYVSDIQLFYFDEGREFTQKEQKNSDDVIIPWFGFLDYSKQLSYLGRSFKVDGIDFKIVGVASACKEKTVFMPLNTFLKYNYDINIMNLTFKKKLNSKEEKLLIQLIKGNDDEAKISIPSKTDPYILKQFYIKLLVYTVSVLFALINVISLFKFWLLFNLRQYTVYKLCGATNRAIYSLIMLEASLLSIFPFLLGFIIYLSVAPVLKSYKVFSPVSAPDLIICVLIMLACILGVVHGTAKKIVYKAELYNISTGGA